MIKLKDILEQGLAGGMAGNTQSSMLPGNTSKELNLRIQIVKNNFQQIQTLANNIWKSRDASWTDSFAKKILGNNRSGMFNLAVSILLLKKIENPSVSILSTIIALILRESKGEFISVNRPRDIAAYIANIFGGNRSRGYAQIQPEVAKEFGIDPSTVETMTGSVNALYKILSFRYKLAVKKGYSGSTITVWNPNSKKFEEQKAINNDAALHVAMASHNGGVGVIQKWCKTNKLGLAAPCGSVNYKDDRITNNDQPINNYIPRFKSRESDTVEYMKQNIKTFNSIKPSIEYAFANPLKNSINPSNIA